MSHDPIACDCPSDQELLAEAHATRERLLSGDEPCPPWCSPEDALRQVDREIARLVDRLQPPEALNGFDTDLE